MIANLLVIEDDTLVARTIEHSLRSEEFHITVVNSGVEGLKAARKAIPDLVVLDVVMPGMDGYTVCREMRNDPLLAHVPVLFLTAKIKDEDRITGFVAGGDDYLTKPFNVDELILRVRAILRRTKFQTWYQTGAAGGDVSPRVQDILSQIGSRAKAVESNQCLVIGEYVLDTRSYELHTPARGKLRLTPIQYDLLYHLMSHPKQIYSPERLLDEVWNYPANSGSPDLVRVHIKNLRERIEADPSSPKFIRTVPGYGYTIDPENGL